MLLLCSSCMPLLPVLCVGRLGWVPVIAYGGQAQGWAEEGVRGRGQEAATVQQLHHMPRLPVL